MKFKVVGCGEGLRVLSFDKSGSLLDDLVQARVRWAHAADFLAQGGDVETGMAAFRVALEDFNSAAVELADFLRDAR